VNCFSSDSLSDLGADFFIVEFRIFVCQVVEFQNGAKGAKKDLVIVQSLNEVIIDEF